MVYELTEKEFLTLLRKYIQKAQILGDTESLNQYINLLKQYEKFKRRKDYILKFYFDEYEGVLYFYPISKKEYEVFKNKWWRYGIM